MQWVKLVAGSALALGIVLLALNVAGPLTSYGGPPKSTRPADHLGESEQDGQLPVRGPRESDIAFFHRTANHVRRRMTYGWGKKNRVAWTDNWLLALAGHLPSAYANYEFTKPERALGRGFGVCSQYVNVVFVILARNGYEPRNVLFPNHNVIAVRTRNGREVVVDALFGIVIENDIDSLRRRPALVTDAYVELDKRTSPIGYAGRRLAREMRRAFSKPIATTNVGSVTPQTSLVETPAYVAKWLLPILLCGASLVLLRRRRTRAAGRAAPFVAPRR